MSITALHAGASGLRSMDFKLGVLANNLANINTVGFKRSRTNFEDLFYQVKREPGLKNLQDEAIPHGIMVGLGSNVSGTQLDFTVGSIETNGNSKLDMFIQGEGFFQVLTTIGGQERVAYTRAGNFTKNVEGTLVLGNSLGSPMEPQIQIPEDALRDSVTIGSTGIVTYQTADDPTVQEAGQIELARFVNPEGLKQIGSNLYLDTEASGQAITGEPGEDGLGTILQNALELSNVDPARELVNLILTQRGYELNSQSIQAADDTLQVVANLRR